MKGLLCSGQRIVADGGYKDEKCILAHDVVGEYQTLLATVRARQETVDRRFKQFFVVGHRYRHNICLHSACFQAVAIVTQLTLERGSQLFQVQYIE